MDLLSEISMPTMAMASALSLTAAAYLNAKLAISTDLSTIYNDRSWTKRLGQRIAQLGDTTTIYKLLERVIEVDGQGAADALWFENKTWTYRELKDLVDQLAAVLHERDIKAGDTVGVFATNSLEMVVAIYALSRTGAVAALLNTNLRDDTFIHCLNVSGAKFIISTPDLSQYLLSTPPSPYDRDHSCIAASGNGLRGEIWERFRQRFGVPEIREFYRSTEGVAKFDNFGVGAWGVGKVGFSGPIRRFFENDVFIVKYDTETEMPYRDPKTSFCVKARLGEEGEAIGRVRSRGMLTEYLHNEEATEKKLLRDVFQKGDLFQRTGDLVVQDEDGWVKFQDRVGDTFRWKGENVSAGEVRDHICRIPSVHDAVVYGVKLQGYDGQAGAAGITLEDPSATVETELISSLHRELKKKGVPSYALPRLVRIIEKVATGVTFKQAKGDLTKKGWDPRLDWKGDKLYWLNGTKYERLDERSWSSIESGQAKL
ncbi:hypothetical protein BBP40_004377 [Aspergillus hancockii]|nr:hypothetical protein BBP40_004377 [Aspergillus hancockii]